MEPFFIGIIIALSIFVATSTIVIIRRRKQNKRFPGQVIEAPAPHMSPAGYSITQMPVGSSTTTYQTHVYAVPYPPQGATTQMHVPMPMSGENQPRAPGMQP